MVLVLVISFGESKFGHLYFLLIFLLSPSPGGGDRVAFVRFCTQRMAPNDVTSIP